MPLKHLENTFKIEGLEYRDNIDLDINSPLSFKNMQKNREIKDGNINTLDSIDKLEHTLSPKDTFNLNALLKDCKTYDEAFLKLESMLKGSDLELAKDELSNYIANAMIYGKGSVHNDL
ncbi:hypothetical protein [Helicobacter bilis]|uniref:hypothetical protein n=1 Tax=Helicobacter bilis TaxID=37372 RepID=UPI00255825B3|nr:hypothetical protein [Helicobacter bilis]